MDKRFVSVDLNRIDEEKLPWALAEAVCNAREKACEQAMHIYYVDEARHDHSR